MFCAQIVNAIVMLGGNFIASLIEFFKDVFNLRFVNKLFNRRVKKVLRTQLDTKLLNGKINVLEEGSD